ncbi:betaine-aldehyde dehydrogenase [Sinosporangium album]|uniref:Betaine-aldehyde dehydrogenase n=1 Tax=Sinosporangium album TaxID=504805 RepID=A0A1G8E4U3_9ACTN|nr:aldehyde dehydrogenase family protein [Sinosporangium album]SDH64659.1 betaine-aldehyde dehydrogenase [Sinosporangium album]
MQFSSVESTSTAESFMLIDGDWTPARTDEWIDVESPATRQPVGRVPRGNVADIDRAVQAAATAFRSWRGEAPAVRGLALLRIADDIEADSERIARLLASETGNAIRRQARPEVASAAALFRYFGGVAGEAKGETVPLGHGLLNYTVREPLGVVGGIIPWNAPVQLASVKIAMALITGNTLVLKAAEDAPLAVLEIARICSRHLPPGVLNVVTGYGVEAGAALLAHPGVDKLSFTGSTEVGKIVMRAAADRILPVSLELGGKSPVIVFPDADEDAVAAGVVDGMRFTRQGQSCTAGSRLLVHASIFDSFLDRVVEAVSRLRMGDPLDERSDLGTVVNQTQYNRVRSYIDDGLTCGATPLIGGLPAEAGPGDGLYVPPTVFRGVEPSWRVVREEIFGPVLVAIPWHDEAEALRMANDTHYGLAAYVWSHDIGRALRTAHAIDAGWVQVNRGLGQLPGMSYGGIKQSGLGREFSLEGALDSFTHRKTITVDTHATPMARG